MATVIRPSFKRRHQPRWPGFIVLALGVALVLAMIPLIAPVLDGLTPPRSARVAQAHYKIEVVDGDTIRYQSNPYRLVGFNTPESGLNAQCNAERVLAGKATRRLRQLLASGPPHLQQVRCACPPGTEGTEHCNNGRLCAVLTVSDVDVGETLIAEGLAERYICRGTSCPRRRNWCG